MNDVVIWAEMLAVPVVIGLIGVVVCYLRDEREIHKWHKLHH